MDDAFGRRVTKLGALADPVRRALYRFVADQPGAVSRDQAADGIDVPRHTAKFHLDRLVDEGLLVAEFKRLTGRTGPGAGRPAKLYRRSRQGGGGQPAEPTLRPGGRRPRRRGGAQPGRDARWTSPVREAATDAGARAVEAAPRPARRTPELDRVAGALAPFGYEPRVDGDLLLQNCPFDRLATDHTDLVCGMNLAFVEAVADGLGCTGLRPELDPDSTRCCVRVRGPGHTSTS